MNDIREIVAKAVIGKGKKLIKLNNKIQATDEIDSILGSWVINHNYTCTLNESSVEIKGSYEINVWYSSDGNTKTDLLKETVEYNETIYTRIIVDDIDKDNREIIVKAIQKPTCTDAIITSDGVEISIVIELLAEVIGETKMIVSVFRKDEVKEDFVDNFENEINENFLNINE